ncbi:MAG: hypothetical protein V1720_12980 [bacterium]
MELSQEEKINNDNWYVVKKIRKMSLRTRVNDPIPYWVYSGMITGGIEPADEVQALRNLEKLGVIKILNPGGAMEHEQGF